MTSVHTKFYPQGSGFTKAEAVDMITERNTDGIYDGVLGQERISENGLLMVLTDARMQQFVDEWDAPLSKVGTDETIDMGEVIAKQESALTQLAKDLLLILYHKV